LADSQGETTMKVHGPLITLAAVAAMGTGMLIANISQEPDPVVPGTPVAASTPAPAPPAPATPPAPAFPAKADYIAKIPTANGTFTVDISVAGDKAVAYACDGNSIESWLRGSATNGTVSLANKHRSSRLEGRLDGTAVVGTLWIGAKKWDFTAEPAQPPAGLYLYEENGVRGSWIIDSSGKATGVMSLDDGAKVPAPVLAIDGSAVIDGRAVTATRVQGASDV
jgi:hypothetical protein